VNVYEIVTSKIIEQLESGVVPWKKTWRCEPPANLISGKEYRGLNVFLLATQGYGSRYWLTYAQATKLGGHVIKGQKSSLVTFWRVGEEKLTTDANGHQRKSRPFLLRYYNVFNVQQTDLAEKLGLTGTSPRTPSLDQCEAILTGMPNPPKREQSHAAWYKPSIDTIGLPNRSAFDSSENYYATWMHEAIHATGHASRVGREGIETLNSFGSELYSKEELVAEMGASMLAGVCGISPATIENSAAYLKSWIDRLRGDSKLIISAASAAQKAADYIRGLAPTQTTADDTGAA
jgi:antirestriction protein ArdC